MVSTISSVALIESKLRSSKSFKSKSKLSSGKPVISDILLKSTSFTLLVESFFCSTCTSVLFSSSTRGVSFIGEVSTVLVLLVTIEPFNACTALRILESSII